MLLADEILAAKKCGDLFSKADKDTVTREYRDMAREFHPDRCTLPNADDIFKHLHDLYNDALKSLEKGEWEVSNVITMQDNSRRTFRTKYLKAFTFELGMCYIADRSVTGHNVTTPDGTHHTFSHFGAGSFNEGVATYLAEDFILNPILFCQELEELKKLGLQPKVYIDANCRITTPYDMMLNQMLEKRRGENRHGSCGVGINETVQRYNKGSWPNESIFFKDIGCLNIDYLGMMRHCYFAQRLRKLNIFEITDEEYNWLNSPRIIEKYLTQVRQMTEYCTLADSTIFDYYDSLVFEGAQGLLIDQDYLLFAPYLTSSRTGSYNPKKILLESGLQNEDIEFCYVTRSYFTRHGEGPFPTECTSEELFGKEVIDKYNPENEFQGKFRYGYFDRNRFYNTVSCDSNFMIDGFLNAKVSIAITHLDETDSNIIMKTEKILPDTIKYWRYTSYGPTRCDVMKW